MVNIRVEIDFDELVKVIEQLPDEKKRALNNYLSKRIEAAPETETPPKERILGLHPGAFQPSDDFDAPLPDEFWMGEDT